MDAGAGELLAPALSVRVLAVAAVDDDVPLRQQRHQLGDELVHRRPG